MRGTSLVLAPPLGSCAVGGAGNLIQLSVFNSYIFNAAAERLALHVQFGNPGDRQEFYNLCLALAQGIDYALANGQIPDKARDLPTLMKQICQRKNDELSQAAVMVLMISVKNACKIGWFQTKESEELCTIADEMGKFYCSMGNVNAGHSSCHYTVPTIMARFYPKMKLGQILASIEAKPGYGASTIDFHIAKSTGLKDKIWLLVVQIDDIETSACLISPQQVNFLLNGKGVEKRTNVLMDTGPQMPTDVTGMLQWGSNLLQAVGQFNGHYVILVAYVSVTSLLPHPVLQDYVQPAVTSVDSDPDIIEGPSQISLNCPLSFKRIKTPVKGRSCKHFQCFDFDNFININSRRPSWRCPHCNQCVSYADIRLDCNMVEVLKDVGENVVEVIVHADGSWKAVLESNHNDKAHNYKEELTEPQESTCSLGTVPNVLDLTNDDDQMEIMDTFETSDRKPFQADVQGQFVTPNSTSFGMNSVGVNQNVSAQIDDLGSGLYIARGSSDTPTVGASEHPTPPDTVSPASNQQAGGHNNNFAVNSVMHNQFSAPNNSQLQLNYNSVVNEYGTSSLIPRHISRSPVAVQALPVQSPALGPQQNSRARLNSLLPSSSTTSPHVSLSNAILSDTERQQHFYLSPMNRTQVSGVNSSMLQHHSAIQNQVPPVNMSAPGQLQDRYGASGLLRECSNSHLQQALNPQAHQPIQSSNTQQSHIQQGGSQAGIVQTAGGTVNSHQTRTSFTADGFRGLTGERRGPPQSVSRSGDLLNLQSEQNRRPTTRMRGSLDGKAISDDLRQLIIAPTEPSQSSSPQGPQPVQSLRPQGPLPVGPSGVSPQLEVLIANNRNARNHSSHT